MNSILYFEIQSSNLQESIHFYQTVFGWNFVKEEDLSIEYYRIETLGIAGALLQRPAKTPPPEFGTNAFTCSVMVDNFDQTEEKIKNAGGQIAMPRFAVPGKCWQGYFLDNDHNVFGIFQIDENAK